MPPLPSHPRTSATILCLLLHSSSPLLLRPFFATAAAAFPAPPPSAGPLAFSSSRPFRRLSHRTASAKDGTKAPAIAMAQILESPSAERNKDPILGVICTNVLPEHATSTAAADTDGPLTVLEVAAGCGVHTLHLTRGIISKTGGAVKWHPTDPEPRSRASVDARVDADPTPLVKGSIAPAESLTLNEGGTIEGTGAEGSGGIVGALPDPIAPLRGGMADLVVNVNMIHISPWGATVGLMRVASDVLRKGGILYCYGPYKVGGTAVESNLNFDRSLQSRDPSWGVRDLEKVVAEAEKRGLELVKTIEMPANNLSVIYRKK